MSIEARINKADEAIAVIPRWRKLLNLPPETFLKCVSSGFTFQVRDIYWSDALDRMYAVKHPQYFSVQTKTPGVRQEVFIGFIRKREDEWHRCSLCNPG